MKVYIMNYGVMELDANMMLQYATLASKSNPAMPAKWLRIPVWGALIVTEEHKILFDLGCLPDAMEGGWAPSHQDMMPIFRNEDEYVDKQLQKVGLTPQDIDTVVLSHLHCDHFGAIEQFTHCDVYLPREDWVNALIKTHETSDPRHGGSYVKRCIEAPVKRYHPIEKGDDFELFPGIEIITLPGHAPGLLGLVLHLENDGVLIFPSDAISMQETYDHDAAPSTPYDGVEYAKSVEKVRRLERKYNAKVIISHSMELFQSLKKIPEYYD